MAARRPAKEQPAAFSWSDENLAWCAEQLKKYPEDRKASAVIPFLWQGQKQEGWISIPMMETIGAQLSMPYIRVFEVASFYTMFNLAPVGKYFIQVCGTTPCMLRGSSALIDVCKDVLGEENAVSSDGKFSWLEVECLGACCNAPMIQVSTNEGDHYYEDLNEERLRTLLDKLGRDEVVAPGPQVDDRKGSEPAGGATTLTDPALYDGSAAKPLTEIPNAPAPAE